MKNYKTLLVSADEENKSILRIQLNRPKVHHAFNDVMIAELTEVFQTLEEPLSLVILQSSGESFCSGADLHWMGRMVNFSYEENKADAALMARMFKIMSDCPCPVMANVQGHVFAGGVGLLAVCDYVCSSHHVQFSFPEAYLGLVPAVISPYVEKKIGRSWTKAMFLTCEKFDTGKALAMGLIHHVALGQQETDLHIKKMTKQILSGSACAHKKIKELLSHDLEEERCIETIAKIRVSEDAQKRMNELLGKNKK